MFEFEFYVRIFKFCGIFEFEIDLVGVRVRVGLRVRPILADFFAK